MSTSGDIMSTLGSVHHGDTMGTSGISGDVQYIGVYNINHELAPLHET